MAEEIVNKVKQSKKLQTIDLQNFYDDTPIAELDIKDFLFKELMLKEEDYRQALEEHDWSQYDGQYLAVYCSSDAILAPWAFMLVAAHAKGHAEEVFIDRPDSIRHELYRRRLDDYDWSQYEGKFVLLKGCSDVPVPESVYVLASQKLMPYVGRLMYGEACSFVPVFRPGK